MRSSTLPAAALAAYCLVAMLACHERTNPDADAQPPAPGNIDGGFDDEAGLEPNDAGPGWLTGLEASTTLGQFGGQDAGSTRTHDTKVFSIAVQTTDFPAPYNKVETDRFSGLYEGGGYRLEVPKNWNGELVVYAHGYVGTSSTLAVQTPGLREHWIEQGFAWVASSYSRNDYDVRAGIEDSNKLALDFVKIAAEHGRALAEPTRRYIVGHSMGGHVAAAAVEQETLDSAQNRLAYDGALPMCAVLGDSELFNYLVAYQIAAQQLAKLPATSWPVLDYLSKRDAIQAALFTMFPTTVTDAGKTLRTLVMNLTGGRRPIFELGFASPFTQSGPWSTFGGDGTIGGILEQNIVDTRAIDFQLDDDPGESADEAAFNTAVFRVVPDADPNPRRPDGLRFIPKVDGEITTKVVTLHTLGDLYVPFSMEQIYRRRVSAHGHGDDVVQRATRGIDHCAFDLREESAAFDALVNWVEHGVKPEGDDVLDKAALADPNYGCKFTARPLPPDLSSPPSDLSASPADLGGPPPPPPPDTSPGGDPVPALASPSAPPCTSW